MFLLSFAIRPYLTFTTVSLTVYLADPYNIPPFYGLGASDGKWYFDDEIYYSKDINTVQLRVRYAHDPLKDRRVHVVLVDRNDPTHIVSYDEVLIDNKPTVTNFKRSADDKV